MTEPADNVVPFSIDQQLDMMARDAARTVAKGGGGDGPSDGLAPKVAVLEADMKEIRPA